MEGLGNDCNLVTYLTLRQLRVRALSTAPTARPRCIILRVGHAGSASRYHAERCTASTSGRRSRVATAHLQLYGVDARGMRRAGPGRGLLRAELREHLLVCIGDYALEWHGDGEVLLNAPLQKEPSLLTRRDADA